MMIMIPDELATSIRLAWSADTAAADNTWSIDNPSAGHCDVTSLLVREKIGGDLRMAQVFRNGELCEHHFWNVLPNGTELDVTREQFDGSETFGPVTEMDAVFFAAAGR